MRLSSLLLATCCAGALLSPAIANATVIFDNMYVQSTVGVSFRGDTRTNNVKKTFTSLANVEGGVAKDVSISINRTLGDASASSDSGAGLTSSGAGSFTFGQTADSSTDSAIVTAGANALGFVDYTFSLSGPKLYALTLSTVVGPLGGQRGSLYTELWDDTTSTAIWTSADLSPGDSFNTVLGNLANGTYELWTQNHDPLDSSTFGVGGLDNESLNGTTTFSLAAGVPEPATWALLGLGVFGVGAIARRQRQQKAAALA